MCRISLGYPPLSLLPKAQSKGPDTGGERAATIYILLGSPKLNGLDPEDYLRQVLERIADHPVKRVHEVLPWNLAQVRPRLDQRNAA